MKREIERKWIEWGKLWDPGVMRTRCLFPLSSPVTAALKPGGLDGQAPTYFSLGCYGEPSAVRGALYIFPLAAPRASEPASPVSLCFFGLAGAVYRLADVSHFPQCSTAMGSQASGDNDLPLLLKRSHLGSVHDHDVRFANRNAEDVHRDALAAALAEHERVREAALRAYELNELRQEQERLRQHALEEEERVRIETERAKEECRLREIENKKKQIPVPAPRAKTPPPPRVPSPPVRAVQAPTPVPAQPAAPSTQKPAAKPPAKPPIVAPTQVAPTQAAPSNLFQSAGPKPAPPTQPAPQETVQSPQATVKSSSHTLPHIERYAEIHQTLKKLRAMIVNEGKRNLAFKKKTGEMRRAIRTSMGQLTGEKGSNKQPVSLHIPSSLLNA